uniref:Na_Ca_ex domain-containing protein n=1 Tax=Macrostomum lignano TaxID=282301 RepID=A0A1I8FNM0_9PLAT
SAQNLLFRNLFYLSGFQVLHLDWRPLARDSVWYLISILFFIFVMYDSIVQIWDAVILLVLYALYIVIMVLNSRLMDRLAEAEKKCACSKVEPGDVEGSGSSSTGADASAVTQSTTSIGEHREVKHFKHDRRNSVLLALHDSKLSVREGDKESSGAAAAKSNGEAIKSKSGKDEVTAKQTSSSGANQEESKDAEDSNAEEDEGGRIACCACCSCCPDLRGAPPERPVGEDGGRPTCCQGTVYVLKWIVFVLAFRLSKVLHTELHHVNLWIAAVSFCMVTVWPDWAACLALTPLSLSLVVLAAGTSIPDLLSSIIVVKDGSGDMAVSNAIGSNVFDIDLGLGLPFFIKLMEPIDMFSDKERERSGSRPERTMPRSSKISETACCDTPSGRSPNSCLSARLEQRRREILRPADGDEKLTDGLTERLRIVLGGCSMLMAGAVSIGFWQFFALTRRCRRCSCY